MHVSSGAGIVPDCCYDEWALGWSQKSSNMGASINGSLEPMKLLRRF